MPFGEYTSFSECVSKNKDKRNPEAYCAEIEKQVTGKYPSQKKTYEFVTNSMNYETVETKEGKKYYVSGYISTYDMDLVNDIVTPEGMKDMLDQLQRRSIKLDLEHESYLGDTHIDREVAKTKIPIGKIIEGRLNNKGLFIKAQINNNHQRFNEAWKSIKEGFLDAFSIAYIPIKTVIKTVEGVQARLLDKVTLLNVAFTGNPANPHATMAEVFTKSLNDIKLGEKAMVKEETKEEIPEEEPEKVEPKKEEPVEESKDELTEIKSELAELKKQLSELKEDNDNKEEEPKEDAELKKLTTEIAEIKKTLEKPQYKAVQENMDENIQKNQETKSKGPIDYII